MSRPGPMNPMAQAIRAAATGPLTATAGGATAAYSFEAGFPGYDGHFPGFAILPAVVQLLAAATLVEDWRGQSLTLVSVENAKFLIQLHPGRAVTIRCRERLISGRRRFDVSLEVDAGLAASALLGFAEDAGR